VVQWTLLYVTLASGLLQLIGLYTGGDVGIVRASMWVLIVLLLVVVTLAWYHGGSERRRMSGAELLIIGLLIAIGGGILWLQRQSGTPPETTAEPAAAGRLAGKKIVVMSLMSGGAAYEKIILAAFRDRAQKRIEAEGGTLEWKLPRNGHDVSPREPAGKQVWDRQAENILRLYSKVDYLLSVGTFASVAMKDHDLASALGAKGQIFLGVTDPVGARLVEDLKPRAESTNIAGVRYGRGGEAFGQYLSGLFPADRKLVFVREESTPQDRYMAQELARVGRITDYAYAGNLDVTALDDPDAVYFAWYGFDNVLADEGGDAALLLDMKVVPSTCTEELLHGAGIVVSVNDYEVGASGADLMLEAILDDDARLGHFDVVDVDFQHWIDWETVQRKGIKLKVARDALRETRCPDGYS